MDEAIRKSVVELTEKALPGIAGKLISLIPGSKQRKTKARGGWERRQNTRDRRVSDVDTRLREGFWIEYHRRTGAGRAEPMTRVSVELRKHLAQAFVTEARHYIFSDRNSQQPVEPSTIIDPAIEIGLSRLQSGVVPDAATVVHGIADYILSRYNVTKIDRRVGQRRSQATA